MEVGFIWESIGNGIWIFNQLIVRFILESLGSKIYFGFHRKQDLFWIPFEVGFIWESIGSRIYFGFHRKKDLFGIQSEARFILDSTGSRI